MYISKNSKIIISLVIAAILVAGLLFLKYKKDARNGQNNQSAAENENVAVSPGQPAALEATLENLKVPAGGEAIKPGRKIPDGLEALGADKAAGENK